MKLKCLGAGEQVTGSKYLIQFHGKNILIDCGIYQGENAEELNRITHQHIRQTPIDSIILTHAHLDHTGYLPQVYRDGFQGSVYCTKATRDLAQIILLDNSKIIAGENRDPKKDIFYTEQDVKHALGHMQAREFNEAFKLYDLNITFQRAGHILGAASVVIESENKKIVLSGDLGRDDDLIIQPAYPAPIDASTIVMEGTYGDRNHPQADPNLKFKQIIEGNTGTIMIPAFSLGRSQTMMFFLSQFFEAYPELEIPVVVDSPMTISITNLYPQYIQEMKITKEEIKSWRSKFKFIEFAKQRKKLAESSAPKILLSASGMLTGGHIMTHLAQYIEDPKSSLILTGFQSPGTLGHQILNGANTIEIEKRELNVGCQVHQFTEFSSHQDSDQLMQWLTGSNPKKIYLTHGEKEALEVLKARIEKERNLTPEILKVGSLYPLD